MFIFNHPTGTDQEWKFVHGLYEFAIYGGRVDNTFDLRVMVSYLRQFFDGNTLSQGRNKRLGPLRLPTSTNFRVGFNMSNSYRNVIDQFYITYAYFLFTAQLACNCSLSGSQVTHVDLHVHFMLFAGLCGSH